MTLTYYETNNARQNRKAAELARARKRHFANACEWYRRYFAACVGKAPKGTHKRAIFIALRQEIKLGNLSLDEIRRHA